jgi:hypothetical protein
MTQPDFEDARGVSQDHEQVPAAAELAGGFSERYVSWHRAAAGLPVMQALVTCEILGGISGGRTALTGAVQG